MLFEKGKAKATSTSRQGTRERQACYRKVTTETKSSEARTCSCPGLHRPTGGQVRNLLSANLQDGTMTRSGGLTQGRRRLIRRVNRTRSRRFLAAQKRVRTSSASSLSL